MTVKRNIMIIPISPTAYNNASNLVDALKLLTQDCKKLGYTIINIHINKSTTAIEIHAQKTPQQVTVVNTLHDLREYIEQYIAQMMPIEILPSPIISSKPRQRRTESNLIKNYNRAQTTKYNVAIRNYKGRKR